MTRKTQPAPPAAELRGVSVVRDGATLLSGIDWTIDAGSGWALVGANGSGKTTLLKVLTGYEWPTTGSVRLAGRALGSVPLAEARRSIGWATSHLAARFRDADLPRGIVLTGIDNALGLFREFSRGEAEQADAALARLGAEGIAERPWRLLSQGERQRVLLARAMVNAPSLLILDEPCAGLDPAAREDLLDDLEALADGPQAPAIVLVTHHLEEIRPFIAGALALADGRPLACGPVAEALAPAIINQAFGLRYEVERRPGGGYGVVLERSSPPSSESTSLDKSRGL